MNRYDRQTLTKEEIEQYEANLASVTYLILRLDRAKRENGEISPIALAVDSYVGLREAHFTESEALKLTELIAYAYYKDIKYQKLKTLEEYLGPFLNILEDYFSEKLKKGDD